MPNSETPAVLLVDDRPENLRVIEKILGQLDVDIVTAITGEEAVEAVVQRKFALVILDVMMPGMGGYEAADQIKAIEGLENLPIIFVTSSENETSQIIKGYQTGAVDYLFRPVNATILRSKVEVFLDLYQYQQSLAETAEKLKNAELELTDYITQLEELIARTNELTIEADIASIQLRQVFNTCSEGMWVINGDYSIKQINSSLTQMIGVSEQDALGRKCHEMITSPICQTDKCPLQKVTRGAKQYECDIDVTRDNGTRGSFIVSATPYSGIEVDKVGIVESFKDITERKKMEEALNDANEKLQTLAITDGLTNIPNHRHFANTLTDEWNRAIRSEQQLAVIMCDIDYFKFYNDTYGHQEGDDCLKAVAQAIAKCAQRMTDLVARYGGEEFVVLLPDTDEENAAKVAERVRVAVNSLEIPHESSQVDQHVSVSLGVAAMVPTQDGDAETLVSNADTALYAAKEAGRNRYCLSTDGVVT